MKKKNPHAFVAVKVKRSKAGLGLFAAEDIKKGVKVVEYVGEKITEAEANRRGGKYLFEINSRWTIDGKGRENIARYLNHSCRPNCEPEIRKHEITIHSKRAIKAGEELVYDYGKAYFNEYIKPLGCRCEKCSAKKS